MAAEAMKDYQNTHYVYVCNGEIPGTSFTCIYYMHNKTSE